MIPFYHIDPETLRSATLAAYVKLMYGQRSALFTDLEGLPAESLWTRPGQEKWSVGEHLDHLFRILRVFCNIGRWWIPLARPFASLFVNRPYSTELYDIYLDYERNRGKPMPVPSPIAPAQRIDHSLKRLASDLENETQRMLKLLLDIDDDMAGHIRLFDPVAKNPNLHQGLHVLCIHEDYHFAMIRENASMTP